MDYDDDVYGCCVVTVCICEVTTYFIFWIFKDRCVGKLKTMLTSLIYVLILSINYFVTEKLVAIYDFYFVIIELIFGIT